MARNSKRILYNLYCIERSFLWPIRSFVVLPKSSGFVRCLHHSQTNNFKISFRRLDENDFKDYTAEDWKKHLSSQQYYICREKGTEPPWSGELLHIKDAGTYCCVCCNSELFKSSTKFDSQSGWPSFWAAIENEQSEEEMKLGIPNLSVDQQIDNSQGMVRVEALCKKCGSHLGHVFGDGPKPTGLRYCINSCSLRFKADVR